MAFSTPENQVQFINLFASQKRKDILPYVVNSLNSENPAIREASIKALGVIGGKSEIELLIPKALGEGTEAELAKASLASMPGDDAGQGMLDILKKPDIEPALKKLLLPLVATRKVPGSEPIILKSAGDADPECRISAIKSLIEQPNAEMLDTILQILPGVSSDEEQELFAELILKIALLNPDETEKQLVKISSVLDSNSALPVQTVLLHVLAQSGHVKGWEKLSTCISTNTPADKLGIVIQALNKWPDDTPVPVLIEFARANPELPHRDRLLETCLNLTQKTKSTDEEVIQRIASLLELNPSASVKKSALEKIAQRKVDSSLPLLLKYLHESEDPVKETLIRSLSNWRNAEPLNALLELARTTDNDSIRRQSLAGVIQLSDNICNMSSEQRTQLFNDVIAIGTKPEILKGIIGALQNTSYPEALAIVTQYLDNEQVKSEAEVAVVKLSKTLIGIATDIVAPALEKVIHQGQMELIKQEAQKTLDIIPKFEDFITTWMVSGPYINDEINANMLYEFVFAPEKPEEAEKALWKPVSPGTNPNKPMVVELHKILGGENRVAYLSTYVWSDTEQDVNLLIGSDDGARIWVNGTKVFGKNANRPCVPDDDTIGIHLKQGWNHILAKIRQGSGEWEFCARIRKSDGSPFEPKLKTAILPK
ncbi:MAG: HEAT repeat domain-containing protein [Candidatus Hydrogenedens sp.]